MTKEQAIKTAVEWWARKLKARAPHSNGDSGKASIMACLLADFGAKTVTDEQLDIFKNELAMTIDAELKDHQWCDVYLGCDYNPTMNLRDAAAKAGISEFNFPYKTDMYIKKHNDGWCGVYVYDGYGSGREELQPVE